jgi:hypothetical protein
MTQETIELENGNKAHFKKNPRFGTWSVNFDKGGIPPLLEGEWQSLPFLKNKLEAYLATRTKNKTGFVNAKDSRNSRREQPLEGASD